MYQFYRRRFIMNIIFCDQVAYLKWQIKYVSASIKFQSKRLNINCYPVIFIPWTATRGVSRLIKTALFQRRADFISLRVARGNARYL